jgi:hypothetical protein
VGRRVLVGCGVWDLSYSVTAMTACDSGLTHADLGNAVNGRASEPVAVLLGRGRVCRAGGNKSKKRWELGAGSVWVPYKESREHYVPVVRADRADGACGCSCADGLGRLA